MSDAKLSPKQCATYLGVSDDYIVGEIHDGRLPAHERSYDSGRKRYRVDPVKFAAYVEQYWPEKNRRAHPRTPIPKAS
jgi:excisionase family DNA binding protein